MSDYDLAAEQAALTWLAAADAGNAAETWTSASSVFRRAVAQEQWARLLDAARAPLGALVSRTLATGEPKRELPGAPDGEYVVLTFNTVFEKKRSAAEIVTPMRDDDGQWRVSGYFIR
jgi:hypothetical protein